MQSFAGAPAGLAKRNCAKAEQRGLGQSLKGWDAKCAGLAPQEEDYRGAVKSFADAICYIDSFDSGTEVFSPHSATFPATTPQSLSASLGSKRRQAPGSPSRAVELPPRNGQSPDHLHQLEHVRLRLQELEEEQRRLINVGVQALMQVVPSDAAPEEEDEEEESFSIPEGFSPAATAVAAPAPTEESDVDSTDAMAAELFAGGNGSDMDRPVDWLLADGRLHAAQLEGENQALKRAVARARQENDELLARRQAVEERSDELERENRARAEALRRTMDLMAARGRSGSSTPRRRTPVAPPPPASWQDHGIPMPGQAAAPATSLGGDMPAGGLGHRGQAEPGTAELREALRSALGHGAKAGPPTPTSQAATQAATQPVRPPAQATNAEPCSAEAFEARHRLLETSCDVDRRLEEILARRSHLLQAVSTEAVPMRASASAPGLPR